MQNKAMDRGNCWGNAAITDHASPRGQLETDDEGTGDTEGRGYARVITTGS
jgi:hypothetical protein